MKRLNVPPDVHTELIAIVQDALGRPPDTHEVGPTLARVVRTAKAATRNADKARQAADRHTRQRYDEQTQKARRAYAAQVGRPDLLWSIYRTGEGAAPDAPPQAPDAPVALDVDTGTLTRSVIAQDLRVRFGWQLSGQQTLDVGSLQGVTGTPFSSTPQVELSQELYPYRGRGLAYNYGQFQAMYRSDAILREGISSLVAVQSGATIQFECPPALTHSVAERLGIDRDAISRAADDLNAALQLGREIEFMAMFREQMRTACINGFGLLEFAIDATAPVTRRIAGLQPRLPNTVVQWIQDPQTGECVAILQTNPGQTFQKAMALDARKVIRMSVDQDGDNFEGVSLVRSARAWDVLEFEFVSSAILHRQRFGAGIPVIKRTGDGANAAAASNSAFLALSQYANLNDAVLELGSGVDVDIKQMVAEAGLAEIVEMCGKRKRSAVRDTIAGLGADGVGAYNLGDIKSQMWMQGLRSFARDSERGWNQLARVYCAIFHPELEVLPVLSINGFATRSPSEVITLQQSFAGLVATGVYTEQETTEIAAQSGVIWNGRGVEADTDDAGAMATADPTAAAPEVESTTAPAAAQRAAAEGRRARANAAGETRWTPTIADAKLAKKVLDGAALDNADLRMLEAFFASIEGDPTTHPEWADRGAFYQQFQSLGGAAMAEWLEVELADVDAVAADPEEPPATRAPAKYNHIDFTPPEGVREAAKRGLEVRAEKPPSQRGGTPIGVARARDLANGRTVSPETARRMKAYFDRHEVDKQGETWDEQGKGWQAWQLWGGDPGRSWSAKLVRQMEAADNETTTRHAGGCGCSDCTPTTRAKGPALFAVPTRTGEFRTWRALTPAESSVAFDRIAEEKTAAVDRMTRAIEAEQRQHRAAFVARAAGLNVAQLSELTVDWTERYRVAMLPALRSLSEFAQTDALAEIAFQIGTPNWTAQSQTPPTGAAQQVEAAARLAAKSVNDRTNERLRGAAIQVANGARPSTLTAAPVSIGTTAGGLLEQTASTTVNETRAVTAAEQGPEIEWATYSAVMDRWTCPECEKADGRRVRYGTDEYRRLSPPNPRCRSVVNSQGAQNLCQCVWVYEFKKPDVTPGPTNTTPGGGLVFRSAPSPAAVRVVLVCGPPGSGKSTWAAAQPGVVVDRDGFVLTEAGYNPDGRAESLAALTEAVQAAAPGGVVHFVACMLTPAARKRVADHVQATADRAVAIEVVAIDRPREVLHAVNAEREGTERGSIPADQLEHILDAWQAPTPDEVNALAGADV